MKKRWIWNRILAAALVLLSLVQPAAAEGIFPETEEPTEYVISDGPIANSSLAFGSVSILNGCRTVDSYVPLGGAERRLDSALSAFAYERNTGTLIYSYNPDTRVYAGGMAKLVNALLVIEHCEMEDIVTVSSRNISRLPAGSKHVDLKEQEQLSVKDLLHCMIMKGANDAAIALAEHVAGNQEAFVTMMNQRVRQIGCSNTEFANVHGLDNKPSYTTARDMARLMLDATRNETFRNLIAETKYTVPETNRSEARSFESEDYLVDSKNIQKFYDKRVSGGFQAVSPSTGASLVCTASERNMDVVFVVMGCTRQLYENGWQVKVYGNFEEMITLMKYVFNNFKANRILYNGQALKQFNVSGGDYNLVAAPKLDLDSVLPSDAHMNNLIMEYKDKGLQAPIQKDDMVSTVEVWYRNTCLLEAELYAMEDVPLAANTGVQILGGANRSNSESTLARYVLIFAAIILVPVGGYLVINSLLRARRRAMIRRRRAQKRRYY